MGLGISLAEHGMVPDLAMKFFIRRLLRQRIREIGNSPDVDPNELFAQKLKACEIAEFTKEANEQHYEVPPEFFRLVLGSRLKYSSCFYEGGARTLNDAEDAMLELYEQRANIKNGDSVLDLGCGWGSFSLWIAKRCPDSMVTAVSNSAQQGQFIREEAKKQGLKNLEVHTADMNWFTPERVYDRIISVEMFEHMRNYEQLFEKVASWLKPDGSLFLHVFSHQKFPYFFETDGDDNWMGRYFFTGGIMPAHDLYKQYAHHLRVHQSWFVNGKNYGQTAMHWLENMDLHRERVEEMFQFVYGDQRLAKIWFSRWRIFFLSCAELFNYNDGKEWDVSHFYFVKP